jgi:hypothetical protein
MVLYLQKVSPLKQVYGQTTTADPPSTKEQRFSAVPVHCTAIFKRLPSLNLHALITLLYAVYDAPVYLLVDSLIAQIPPKLKKISDHAPMWRVLHSNRQQKPSSAQTRLHRALAHQHGRFCPYLRPPEQKITRIAPNNQKLCLSAKKVIALSSLDDYY